MLTCTTPDQGGQGEEKTSRGKKTSKTVRCFTKGNILFSLVLLKFASFSLISHDIISTSKEDQEGLNTVFKESDFRNPGRGTVLKDHWEMEREAFRKDQRKKGEAQTFQTYFN